MKIPGHLATQPRYRGLPVPYVNAWGDECRDELWEIRPDPLVADDGLFAAGRLGQGAADFTKQCPQRQREVVVRGWCQVCRRPVHAKRRLLIASSMSTRPVEIEGTRAGSKYAAISEPWICDRCLPFVLTACPGIRRRAAENDVRVLVVTDWTLIVEKMWHETHGIDHPAIGWVKVLPDRIADVFTSAEYLEAHR